MTPLDAVKYLVSGHAKSKEIGYGMIILDEEDYKSQTFSKIVKSLRMEILDSRLPYTPKIISLCYMLPINLTNSVNESMSPRTAQQTSMDVDYRLQKPYKDQDFIKMCKIINYDYEQAANYARS